MTEKTSSASAFDKLAILSEQRDVQHLMRFQWVKMACLAEALKSTLALHNMLSSDQTRLITDIVKESRFQRAACWTEIERLDGEISTLTDQLNNGVYDHE